MRDELLQNAWAYWHDDPAIEFLNRLLPEFPPFVPEHMSGDATAAPAALSVRRAALVERAQATVGVPAMELRESPSGRDAGVRGMAGGAPMSDGLSGFQQAWADALEAAKRRADEEDQLMYGALQGKPFWHTGPDVEVTGLAWQTPHICGCTCSDCADDDNVKPGVGRGDE